VNVLENAVTVLILLLGVALVVTVVAERVGVPYVVALLVVAAPVTLPGMPDHFGSVVLFVFLPALIFEAAWNVNAASLRRSALLVGVLAVPGVILTAFLVAAGLALTRTMPFVPALLLGTILAATDPIAVIAVFRRTAVPLELATIVEGESLFNDGAAIVLYSVVINLLTGAHAAPQPAQIAWAAVSSAFGGATIGFAVAASIARLLRGSGDAALQVVGTIVAAFGSYLLADRFHLSGIFAAVVAGIALRGFPRFSSPEASIDVDRFWSVLAYLANAFVFVLMGFRIEFRQIVEEPLLVISTLVLVTLARIALAYVAAPLATGGLPRGWKPVIALSGMRGALSVALAIGLPADVPYRHEIIDAVFGVVFVTLVLQGLCVGPVIVRLKLATGATLAK
jgi:CPA1 family monovalent cation:H+ antiporter